MSSGVHDMSWDSLYQQILLAEQQGSKNSRQLHEVKSAITKAEEQIKSFTEKLEHAHTELDEKARLESEMTLQLHLIKRQQREIQKKKEDLLERQKGLRQDTERMNREAAEEKEKFMTAIRTFNSDFNLLRKRDTVFQSQTRSEIQSLQSEAEALTKEMERMKQENSQLISLQTERESLSAELQGLHSHLADLERELEEAAALTDSLKTERESAVQKPLTDSTCLRLKKELEAHKELEMLHEALSAEIQFLRPGLAWRRIHTRRRLSRRVESVSTFYQSEAGERKNQEETAGHRADGRHAIRERAQINFDIALPQGVPLYRIRYTDV